MARHIPDRDITPTLAAANQWIKQCLVEDGSLFQSGELWTVENVKEVFHAFVEHPDFGSNDFLTKLKGQMEGASLPAKRLISEMLWVLLLFPSNMKAATKRQQIVEMSLLSGTQLSDGVPLLDDDVLSGIGSGGPGFNNYRPDELTFLIALTRNLKGLSIDQRRSVFDGYNEFIRWIGGVVRKGSRQFRHMLRYFAFPERVERISSNNDRRSILNAFEVAPIRETRNWSDQQLDDALLTLRRKLEHLHPDDRLDFYSPSLKDRWSKDRKIKTVEGEVTVVVPVNDDDDVIPPADIEPKYDLRQSIQIQAKLAEIGAIMGFKVWIPRSDRGRVRELMVTNSQLALLDDLPLNYEQATLDTIEQIDTIWLRGRSIIRAFEVEHTTAVYSGLLRMADLLALQPNMDIRLHIVAPIERREKVFREMLRPVFSLLARGPLSRSCTFISYENVVSIRGLEHLAHTNESIIKEYEELAED